MKFLHATKRCAKLRPNGANVILGARNHYQTRASEPAVGSAYGGCVSAQSRNRLVVPDLNHTVAGFLHCLPYGYHGISCYHSAAPVEKLDENGK